MEKLLSEPGVSFFETEALKIYSTDNKQSNNSNWKSPKIYIFSPDRIKDKSRADIFYCLFSFILNRFTRSCRYKSKSVVQNPRNIFVIQLTYLRHCLEFLKDQVIVVLLKSGVDTIKLNRTLE